MKKIVEDEKVISPNWYEQLLYTNTFNLKQGNKSIEELQRNFTSWVFKIKWEKGRLKLLLAMKLDFE